MFHPIRDARFAVRRFRRAPLPLAAAVITLALGIGANTAIFSLADALWMRPLSIRDPGHLIAIENIKSHAVADSERENTESSYAEYEDVRAEVPAFADVAASDGRGVAMETRDGLQLLLAEVVSDNYFAVMGVRPELGRLPSEDEIRRNGGTVVALSHAAWKSLFAGDASVVGRRVTFHGRPATVAAVLPAGFTGTERMIDPQVWVPWSTWVTWGAEERAAPRTGREYRLYARLKRGARLQEAGEQLQALDARLAAAYPQANAGRNFRAAWQKDEQETPAKTISLLLFAVSGAVLLIACTNIASLLLALNDRRRRETAMRTALGARRRDLMGSLLTEYGLLAAMGLGGALFLARELMILIPAVVPNVGIPLALDFRIDHRVLLFTAVLGVVAALLCGLWPALASTRTAPLEAMRVQPAAAGRLRMPARKVFVTAQLAISMALLMATGLLVKTLAHLGLMDMGFSSHENAVLVVFTGGKEGAQRAAELEALASRVRGVPDVRDASVARVGPFPLNGGGGTEVVLAPGEVASETAGTPVWFNQVDQEYFKVMGVSIVRGRAFGRQDHAGGEPVAIVNQTLAKRLFGSEDVVGRRLRVGRQKPVDAEIVGVARDGKYSDVSETAQPYLYRPLAQEAWSDMTLIATTAGDPHAVLPAVRRAIREEDSDFLILTTDTMKDRMHLALFYNRMAAWLTAVLGGLALLLTMVGLYGVSAYAVSRRTHEIGVRMALGARRGSVFASVVVEGLKLAAAGVVLGTGLSLVVGRLMRSLLYDVRPLDVVTLVLVTAVLVLTSMAAVVSPAGRALRVDPAEALREE